jgi:hypothetical protein
VGKLFGTLPCKKEECCEETGSPFVHSGMVDKLLEGIGMACRMRFAIAVVLGFWRLWLVKSCLPFYFVTV